MPGSGGTRAIVPPAVSKIERMMVGPIPVPPSVIRMEAPSKAIRSEAAPYARALSNRCRSMMAKASGGVAQDVAGFIVTEGNGGAWVRVAARGGVVGATQQDPKDREFRGRQRNLPCQDAAQVPGGVDLRIAPPREVGRVRHHDPGPLQDRLDPRHQFARAERFGDVIVCSQLHADDAADIEYHEVDVAVPHPCQTARAILGHPVAEARRLHREADHLADKGIVVDDQQVGRHRCPSEVVESLKAALQPPPRKNPNPASRRPDRTGSQAGRRARRRR